MAPWGKRGQTPIKRRHYDAFGKERHGVATPGTAEALLPLLTNHGFTGHKQLPSVDLVHMEGRVYDPALGRFLSADPFVQAPLSAQSYNRYSYVFNNPLSFTDPSGYFSFSSIFKGITNFIKNTIKAIANTIANVVREVVSFVEKYAVQLTAVAVAIAAPYAVATVMPSLLATGGATAYVAGLSATGTLVAGAVGGGLAGFIATGSLDGALIGLASGMAFAQIGNMFGKGGCLADIGSKFASASSKAAGTFTAGFKAVAHGLVGGVRSVLSGARFEQGFLAAGLTEAFSPAISYAGAAAGGGSFGTMVEYSTAALVGGAGSQLAGGNFADGAITGVFSRAFNEALHSADDTADVNGESFWQRYKNNYDKQLNLLYGNHLEVVDDLGSWGFGSLAAEGAMSGYTSLVEVLANEQIANNRIQGALTGGNMFSRISAAESGARTASRTIMLQNGMKTFGVVGGVITFGATGYSTGARANSAWIAFFETF